MKLQNETKPQNLQDIVKRIWKHFITDDNECCANYKLVCMYRELETGNGCAIGLMLPDSVVARIPEDLFNQSIREILHQVPSLKEWFSVAFINGVTVQHLQTLQRFHDKYFYQLKEKLIEFCREHNLELPSEAIST